MVVAEGAFCGKFENDPNAHQSGLSILGFFPARRDPRWRVFALLLLYLSIGIFLLGFNRTPFQVLSTVISASVLDLTLTFIFRSGRLFFPLSAVISALSLCILLNYAHGTLYAMIPVLFCIGSKYFFTVNGKHVFNPSLFGIVLSLLVSDYMVDAAPAYQWGGGWAAMIFFITLGALFFISNIRRSTLILTFILSYSLQLAFRAWLTRYHVPAQMLFLGMLSSPSFYLFAFFMITDPKTSPETHRGQILLGISIVLIDLLLHKFRTLSTLFYAAFICQSVRFIWLHYQNGLWQGLKFGIKRLFVFSSLGVLIWPLINASTPKAAPEFRFLKLNSQACGFVARPSDVLTEVDPRLAHIAKWLLSIGDSVSVADVNKDGLVDIFLSLTLKTGQDRATLYLNRGNFKFEKFDIPELDNLRHHPKDFGVPTDAIWFDYDNDSDLDLFISVAFGFPVLLKNYLSESGRLSFRDVTKEGGLHQYGISVSAEIIDANRDGRLDLLIANALPTNLPEYNQETILNIFKLPDPEFPGDRRMFNFMHRTWYDASNGGEKLLYINHGTVFKKLSPQESGLSEARWTLDIASGDLDGDGYSDIYFANDFGPDQLFRNMGGRHFEPIAGSLVGSLGRDTYKGMNASLGDFDNNGFADIYVSNVHSRLQAEGSLLWMNQGTLNQDGPRAFIDQAVERQALNEKRFGWGATIGDIDRDGRLDILQANGHLDDLYDKRYSECPDFWYWNSQIGLTPPNIHGFVDAWPDMRGFCIFPNERNRIYVNKGSYFLDIAEDVGWNEIGTSRAIALADFDNDGDLDAVVTHLTQIPSIYLNEAEPKGNLAGWLGLQLEGNGVTCNNDALGTRIEIEYLVADQKISQSREVYGSSGLLTQNDRRIFFGLGQFIGSVNAKISWCGSDSVSYQVLESNKYYHLQQNSN